MKTKFFSLLLLFLVEATKSDFDGFLFKAREGKDAVEQLKGDAEMFEQIVERRKGETEGARNAEMERHGGNGGHNKKTKTKTKAEGEVVGQIKAIGGLAAGKQSIAGFEGLYGMEVDIEAKARKERGPQDIDLNCCNVHRGAATDNCDSICAYYNLDCVDELAEYINSHEYNCRHYLKQCAPDGTFHKGSESNDPSSDVPVGCYYTTTGDNPPIKDHPGVFVHVNTGGGSADRSCNAAPASTGGNKRLCACGCLEIV